MNDHFQDYRAVLFSIAYRMLGNAMEAEDIVQEAYLRYQQTNTEEIQSHQAFLTTIVTRLCLNQLSSARIQRETYLGPWLPEPIITGQNSAFPNPAQHMETYDSISIAFLVLLENLSPPERAVFLLHEVFDYSHSEIAQIVGKEEVACRQLLSRAKKHLSVNRPRYQPSPEKHREYLQGFMDAVEHGKLEELMTMLHEDVTLWSDGGGKVTAAIHPIHGRDGVAKFMIGTTRFLPEHYDVRVEEINGQLGILIRFDEQVRLVIVPDFDEEGRISAVRIVAAPDKLRAVSQKS